MAALTLADLAPPLVTVDVKTPYGRELVVPLQLMSYHEWQELGLLVSDPPVPFTELDASGKPAPNPFDKDYLKKISANDELRTFVRLARALTGGGMTISGKTLVEQAIAIRDTMDSGIVNSLGGFLQRASLRGEVTPHGETFPSVPGGGAADV